MWMDSKERHRNNNRKRSRCLNSRKHSGTSRERFQAASYKNRTALWIFLFHAYISRTVSAFPINSRSLQHHTFWRLHVSNNKVRSAAQPSLRQSIKGRTRNRKSIKGRTRNVVTEDKVKENSSVISSSRRVFVASALIGTGIAVVPALEQILSETATNSFDSSVSTSKNVGNLRWEKTPVNRRTGVTVFDAEQYGYNVGFVTYLSRYLLKFDADCQKWWYSRTADVPRLANKQELENKRLEQFAAFSASVEVGLQEYRGQDGPKRLMEGLLNRYCPSIEGVKSYREMDGVSPLTEKALNQKKDEINEAKRQIALLFGLMEKNQPVDQIRKVVAAVDNGSIRSVQLQNPGAGYAPGYGSPVVTFPEPDAGLGYQRATGRAVLRQNGKVLRVDVVNRGYGYTKPPMVTVSAPALLRFGNNDSATAKQATAKAVLFRSGANKGCIERIQIIDPGAGYTLDEIIRVQIYPPGTLDGVTATATAVREYEVSEIQMVNYGSGYAIDKPIPVKVEPPPLTARVNMNDPLTARIISPDEPLPMTTKPTEEMRKKMPPSSDPSSVTFQAEALARNDGVGGGGGCVGRACYDEPVVALAYPRGAMEYQSAKNVSTFWAKEERRVVGGCSGGGGCNGGTPSSNAPLFFDTQSSAQLLSLLPSGFGLEFDRNLNRYILATSPDIQGSVPGWIDRSNRPVDPEFGPRGRSPIERDMDIGISSYLRFAASGAICCSGVHLALTPIDVVKTKVQTDPSKYPGMISTFRSTLEKSGPSAFFTGWAPTFVGYFCWGGVGYALTEFFRRYMTALAGAEAASLQVPIILLSAGIAAAVGSYVICPFEAVRIRSVAQPDFAPNILKVLTRMLEEEGLLSLFSAVPAFLLKEIPFAMAKFTVFDLSTAWMYSTFPVAREDLRLSLAVSLLGGTLGGMFAAVVSCPADVVISQMKKDETGLGPVQAAELVLETGGPPAFFTGVGLRVIFMALVVSLQFIIYDAVRLSLGIGTDDLKLYLDVLSNLKLD